MADKKISARTAAGALTGAEIVPAIQSGADRKTTAQDIANLVALGFTAENVANKDTDVTLAANSDTKYPSQKAIKAFVNANLGVGYRSAKVTVSSAELLAISTTPKVLIAAPGAGKFILPLSISIKYNYLTAAYATNTDLALKYTSFTSILTISGLIDQTQSQFYAALPASTLFQVAAADIPALLNNNFVLTTPTVGDPTTGAGTLDIYITWIEHTF